MLRPEGSQSIYSDAQDVTSCLEGHPAACAFLLSLQHRLYSLTLSCASCTCTAASGTLPPQMGFQITRLPGCRGIRVRGTLHTWRHLQGILPPNIEWHTLFGWPGLPPHRCAAIANAEREVAQHWAMHSGSDRA